MGGAKTALGLTLEWYKTYDTTEESAIEKRLNAIPADACEIIATLRAELATTMAALGGVKADLELARAEKQVFERELAAACAVIKGFGM